MAGGTVVLEGGQVFPTDSPSQSDWPNVKCSTTAKLLEATVLDNTGLDKAAKLGKSLDY